MSLHAFIGAHRAELIEACRRRSSQRPAQAWNAARAEGVAAFLDQLVAMLGSARLGGPDDSAGREVAPAHSERSEAAARYGAVLLSQGYSADAVVHAYGDVCQAVTGLAIAADAAITVHEFRLLNGCLDDAIAEAVAAHGAVHLQRIARHQGALASRLETLADHCERVAQIALNAHAAILTGRVGVNGATGALLGHSLNELLYLAEQARVPRTDVQGLVAE